MIKILNSWDPQAVQEMIDDSVPLLATFSMN